MCVCMCACARVSLCWDVCVTSLCMRSLCVLVSTCVCPLGDAPGAWALLSSPQESQLHKRPSWTQAWAAGSSCWQPPELPVREGGAWESVVLPGPQPHGKHQPSPQHLPAPAPAQPQALGCPQQPECPLSQHSDWGLGYYLLPGCLPGTAGCSLKAGDHAGHADHIISRVQSQAWPNQCLLKTEFWSFGGESMGWGTIWGSGDIGHLKAVWRWEKMFKSLNLQFLIC